MLEEIFYFYAFPLFSALKRLQSILLSVQIRNAEISRAGQAPLSAVALQALQGLPILHIHTFLCSQEH